MLHTKYCMQQTRFPKPYAANRLIPYPWIFGTITERFFWKKSRIIVGDVTVGTLKMKIRCTNRLSVGLSYDANFKWHMPICVERCHAKQNYMPFFWTITERAFRKKIPKHRNIYKCCNDSLWIFPRETRSVTVPKNGIYFCSTRHLSAHIGICHLKLAS